MWLAMIVSCVGPMCMYLSVQEIATNAEQCRRTAPMVAGMEAAKSGRGSSKQNEFYFECRDELGRAHFAWGSNAALDSWGGNLAERP